MTAPKFYEETSTHPFDAVPAPVYALGDVAYALTMREERGSHLCAVCGGDGNVKVPKTEKPATCPECRGAGHRPDREATLLYDVERLTIGKVQDARWWNHKDLRSVTQEIRYMAEETGVGSGMLWPEGRLFRHPAEAEIVAEGYGAVPSGRAPRTRDRPLG